MKSGLIGSVRLWAALALVAALGACGGDDPTRPEVIVATPRPPERVIWAQTSFENFQSDIWVSIELILSNRGVLDFTVDWTYPNTWMYVYLGRTSCTYAQLSGRSCPFFLTSETKDPKPRVLLSDTLEPGTYYLVLYNVPRDPLTGNGSDNTEAVSLQIGLEALLTGVHVPDGVSFGRTQVLGPQ